MAPTLAAQLLAETSTTIARSTNPSSRNVLALLVGLVALGVGFGLAYWRRRTKGNYPWRLPPLLWGLFFAITWGVAIILLAIAWFTTNDQLPPRPSRYRPFGQPMPFATARKTGAVGAGDSQALRPTMVPGTYGTSLPPHEEGNGQHPAGEDGQVGDRASAPAAVSAADKPAGWRADPTGRHEYRYWSGSAWTKHVSDEGKRSVDPL